MKSAFISFLIISFIGVAVFGFISMIYGADHGVGWVASRINGTGFCPQNGIMDFVFHLDAFKFFSKAVFGVLLIIFLSGIIFSILPKPLNSDDEEDDFIVALNKISGPRARFKAQLNRWLSLHINSPDLNFKAVI